MDNSDKQMSFLFEEGGITDDGMSVDPVSGNEIPPGSMAEEVRDDIPAQLSEGEYVVPADVLRYYGMKFFEDLREQAKMDLQRMDAEGRIGGEPVPAGGPQMVDDLSPEDIAELEAIGVAVGGYITGQPTQSNMSDPYQQQQMMYRQNAPVAMGNTGFNKGGLEDGEVDVTKPTYSQQDLLSMFPAGFSFTQPSQDMSPEFTTVTLYGPQGDMITLTLPTQKELYDQKISEGYTTEQVQVTTESSVGQNDEEDPMSQLQQDNIDVGSIPSDKLEATAKGLSTMNSIATALAATVGLPVTALINTAGVAKYNDVLDRYASEDPEGFAKSGLEKKGSIFGGESSLFEGLKDTDKSGKRDFGDTWLGDLLGFDGEAGIAEGNPGLKASFGGARRTSDSDTGTTTSKSTGGSSSGVTYAQGESPLEKQIKAETQKTQEDYVTSAAAGNKGGLMDSRHTKKRRKK